MGLNPFCMVPNLRVGIHLHGTVADLFCIKLNLRMRTRLHGTVADLFQYEPYCMPPQQRPNDDVGANFPGMSVRH